MGLFDKQRKELPPLLSEAELEPEAQAVDYSSVLDYLVGLSSEEFDKVVNVAGIYRKANEDAAAALGIENEPSTFITQPEMPENTELVPRDVNHIKPKTILDDDDDDADIASILDDEPAFIADDVPEPRKKGKSVDVKAED